MSLKFPTTSLAALRLSSLAFFGAANMQESGLSLLEVAERALNKEYSNKHNYIKKELIRDIHAQYIHHYIELKYTDSPQEWGGNFICYLTPAEQCLFILFLAEFHETEKGSKS